MSWHNCRCLLFFCALLLLSTIRTTEIGCLKTNQIVPTGILVFDFELFIGGRCEFLGGEKGLAVPYKLPVLLFPFHCFGNVTIWFILSPLNQNIRLVSS